MTTGAHAVLPQAHPLRDAATDWRSMLVLAASGATCALELMLFLAIAIYPPPSGAAISDGLWFGLPFMQALAAAMALGALVFVASGELAEIAGALANPKLTAHAIRRFAFALPFALLDFWLGWAVMEHLLRLVSA